MKKPSILVLLFIVCFAIITMDGWRYWKHNQSQISWDVANYYSYLPAYFTNHGSFEFRSNPDFNYPNEFEGYLQTSPYDSLRIPKATYGMSILYSPFFALGYKIAVNQNSPLNGLSEPFSTCLHWGSILYGIFGLILLRNFLVKFFTEAITAITIFIVFFGTGIFYYIMGDSSMSHGYLFFLFSAFLLTTYHWHNKPSVWKSVLIGSIVGLISLIRPTDLIIVLFFVFWPKSEAGNFKNRLNYFLSNYKLIIIIIVVAFVFWIPQMMFWKYRTGHYLYFSYPGERFYWSDPQLINVLFSYRKGWFVYTPLALLAIIGFFFMNNVSKGLRTISVICILTTIYLVSCWWDWFFGGGFGMRALSQHITYLSLPIASLVQYVFNTNYFKKFTLFIQGTLLSIIFIGVSLNLTQSYQYAKGIIHYNSMSEKTYWLVFGKYKLTDQEIGEFWGSLKEPDYDKLRSGENRDQ